MTLPEHVQKAVGKHGVTVIETRSNKHLVLICEKDGKRFKIATSSTPSCPFAHKHIAGDIKRALNN